MVVILPIDLGEYWIIISGQNSAKRPLLILSSDTNTYQIQAHRLTQSSVSSTKLPNLSYRVYRFSIAIVSQSLPESGVAVTNTVQRELLYCMSHFGVT